MHETAAGVYHLPVGDDRSPIKVIGSQAIVNGFGEACLAQAVNSRLAPGVEEVVLNPDAHLGYGAPVGCVMSSPSHIYPGPVGVDIKCSMSLLQTNIDRTAIDDRKIRRELIRAICQRIPTGAGKGGRDVPKSRNIDERLGREAVIYGASKNVLRQLGIPSEWSQRCEDASHAAPDGCQDTLGARLEDLLDGHRLKRFALQMRQLGSYGGGNHFGECEVVSLGKDEAAQKCAEKFGLVDDKVAFLSHCGSRGFGHTLATHQFRTLKNAFVKAGHEFPGGDANLVYAEAASPAGEAYLCDMALGANFATVNHLLINQLVLEAFQQVLPGTEGKLIYFISHNLARREQAADGTWNWVHRKGATRAMPAGHPELQNSYFADSGHPILLPGNPRDGSVVMVAGPGSASSSYSVNHGAGRAMSRRGAKKRLNQQQIDREMDAADILSNCRQYPLDEAPAAYKDFEEVLASVQAAHLAQEVARLQARFVIKDGSEPDD